jgi:hypothetical protein
MIVNVGLVETVDLAELSCQSEDVLESSQMFSLWSHFHSDCNVV